MSVQPIHVQIRSGVLIMLMTMNVYVWQATLVKIVQQVLYIHLNYDVWHSFFYFLKLVLNEIFFNVLTVCKVQVFYPPLNRQNENKTSRYFLRLQLFK